MMRMVMREKIKSCMMKKRLMAVMISVAGMVQHNVTAHQFWLTADNLYSKPGQPIIFSAHLGSVEENEVFPRSAAHIQQFQLMSEGGSSANPVIGLEGSSTLGISKCPPTGTWIASYMSHPTTSTLPAADFNNYLKEEHLTQALAQRKKWGQIHFPGRESYQRFAKIVGWSGNPGARESDRDIWVGHELELKLLTPIGRLQTDTLIQWVIHFRGEPLTDYRVQAFHIASHHTLSVHSDANGVISMKMDQSGDWVIGTTVIEHVQHDPSSDWHSYWATQTIPVRSADSDRMTHKRQDKIEPFLPTWSGEPIELAGK